MKLISMEIIIYWSDIIKTMYNVFAKLYKTFVVWNIWLLIIYFDILSHIMEKIGKNLIISTILYIYIGYKMVNLLNQYSIFLSNSFFKHYQHHLKFIDMLFICNIMDWNYCNCVITNNNTFLLFYEIAENLII